MKEKKEKAEKTKKEVKTNKKENKKESKKNKKKEKESKTNKFIQTIKKKWLIKGTTTCLLVAIIIAIFITITEVMQSLELVPLDFTEEKLYTLTEGSKEKVASIDKDINIYFINYTDDNPTVSLAKQYKKVNDKITVETIDTTERPDIVNKYGLEEDSEGIIVECGEKSKVLTDSDLVTYDMTTYETINIAEEKITSSIVSVSSDKIPKVYFLEGYSNYSLSQNLYGLGIFLGNEINEIDTVDILSAGKIPDDCDTLVITTPNKDFDDIATQQITNYIQSGGNILWFNNAITDNQNMPNVNKILDMYCINPFDVGIILETDTSKMASGYPNVILPNIENATITKKLYNTSGVIMRNATKININEDKLEEAKVQATNLLETSENAFFRKDMSIESESPTGDEQKEILIVGAELEKTLKEENSETGESALTSKLVIYGENYFISDYQLLQTSQYAGIQLAYNKDIALDSIAYLVDREEDIVARKDTGTVAYTPTETQDMIIRVIIFAIPALIIIVGIIIWQIRRRKK